MTDALSRAGALRLAGRWSEALDVLEPLGDDVDALEERIRVLADESLLARDRSDELDEALERLATVGRGDARVEAFVLARRGLKLHAGFLADRSAGEPPEELALFERALEIRRELGDERDVAESRFHVGLVYQVVRGDSPTSRPYFERSYEGARKAGDELLMSYAVRHVAFADQEAGDLDKAESGFRESLELRRAAGWIPGVAAAELALALLLAEQGRRDESVELAKRARSGFERVGADRFLGLLAAEFDELEA